MATSDPMAVLYRRLQEFGLTKKYIKSTILPDWWDDETAANPVGYAEGMMLLSRNLGLNLRSLADETATIVPEAEGTCKFKKVGSTEDADLGLARAMATRVSHLAVEATTGTVLALPKDGAQVRREILGLGNPWVNLANLTDYCWAAGVPVIHLWALPKKVKRPDGLAAVIGGRPVIVLCRKAKSPARLLFILAHELGHIALGHVGNGTILVDQSVKIRRYNDAVSLEGRDKEELAADSFALAALTGGSDIRVQYIGAWPNAAQLATEARELGEAKRIDPGHVLMNFAYSSGNYPLAGAALRYVESKTDASSIIRDRMVAKLDWSRLHEDSSDFLVKATKAHRNKS